MNAVVIALICWGAAMIFCWIALGVWAWRSYCEVQRDARLEARRREQLNKIPHWRRSRW